MANEMDTLKLMEEIIQKENLVKEVDWWTGKLPFGMHNHWSHPDLKGSTYDVPLDEKVGQSLKEILAEYTADGGPVEHINWLKADRAKEVCSAACPRSVCRLSRIRHLAYLQQLAQQNTQQPLFGLTSSSVLY